MWIHGTNLCKVYNYHDSWACGYKQSGILLRLDGWDVGWLVWFWCRSYGLLWSTVTLLDHTLRILIHPNWVVSACNFNLVGANILRVKYRCISAYSLIPHLPWYYPCISFISCTFWVPTISVLILAIFPLPHKPATQKMMRNWSTSVWSCSRAITPGRFPVELWCLSTAMLPRVFNLVFCKDIIR
jgi:hypothetical protein